MQHYFLNMVKKLRFGGKEVKEEDIVKWMNDKVASLPPSSSLSANNHRITGFKDHALATGLVFIDLLQALRPGCITQELVQRAPETHEQKLANAKYVISVARKIGASAFLVPEDIVESNARMILAFVGSLTSLQEA
jgi:plastin-1